MALGCAAVPEQSECGFQRQPLPASVLATARLQRQAPGLGFASALVLTVMGQLSKRFVVQHVHPSFPRPFGCMRRNRGQRELRSIGPSFRV
jgi:hypothetical protein